MGERGLRRASLEGQVQVETERLTLLRARVAQLSSSQRIAEEAAALGMVPMNNPEHLVAPMPSPSPAPSRFDPEAVKRLTSPTP
jgi:hypothetical protein